MGFSADIVLKNGKIISYNIDSKNPVFYDALAIKFGIILEVGTYQEVKYLVGTKTHVIDLQGKTVIPGFIDSHMHIMSLGFNSLRLDLSNTESIEEVLALIEKEAKKMGENQWIIGSRWDESKWKERRYITREELDKVAPNNPVFLIRICGHMGVGNTKAIKILGLDPNREEYKNGFFKEDKLEMVRRRIKPDEETQLEAFRLATKKSLDLGVTSIHNSTNISTLQRFIKGQKNMSNNIRIYAMIWNEYFKNIKDSGITTGFGSNFLRIGAIKLMCDGSVGARTAAFFEPYVDDPKNKGQLLFSDNDLNVLITMAHRDNFQLAVHAIGDRAIEQILEKYEEVIKAYPREVRHRIEHFEFPTEDQLTRVKRAKIITSMQPNFVGNWSDFGGLYEQRLGRERLLRNNPYREIIDMGIPLAFGSDGMPFDPIYGIWSAVNHPIKEHRITPFEALKAYTINGAYASFEENIKGSIEEGKIADLTILSDNILEVPHKDIRKIKALGVIVSGKIARSF